MAKDNYRKYWKVTLTTGNFLAEGEKRIFNRVESLDKFFKNVDRDIEFEIERLSKKEYEETEK